MNNCIHCGKEIKKEAKFCPTCGKSQSKPEPVDTPQKETVLEKTVQMQQNLNEQLKSNQTVQQLKKESKNYFSWLNTQIKGTEEEKAQRIPIFGVINFLLLIVFNSIAISRSIVIISYFSSETPLSLFIESLLLLGTYFFLFVVVFYFISNKRTKKKMLFSTAFDSLFSPASLAVYVSLLSLVLSFLLSSSFMIVSGLFCLSALLVSLSFTDNLWKQEDVWVRFCLTLFTLILSFGVIYFIFQLLGGSKIINLFLFSLFY
ncbi:hypothetical protein DOK67_0002331 [Enterococcus sp. DIV0212c]|uniref:zinc ribbon domain-containing protein n=1 Tax=Enterococcus sp. DIV0212c TaxID=2230867 RepID=UPI001A9BC907|nr:zinc ribbon domain-containing protein [Enterococcus sp. DIV0212c]MBO1355263.1 zinc ribbon domain-containing protein [Enterococcus sp. DIV0212c]